MTFELAKDHTGARRAAYAVRTTLPGGRWPSAAALSGRVGTTRGSRCRDGSIGHMGQMTSIPAASQRPAPETLGAVKTVHAVDGDSTMLCAGDVGIEQIDHGMWADVSPDQRCNLCDLLIGSTAG
jgi:hypothetical protein